MANIIQAPDFRAAAQSFHNLGDQMQRIADIPALDGTAAILQELRNGFRSINDRFDRVELRLDRVEARLDRVEARLDHIECSTSAERVNSVARLENSRLSRPTMTLSVLHSYTDNTPIPNFPTTPQAISALTVTALNPILRLLDLSVAGNVDENKRRLRQAAGFYESPV